MDRLKAMQTFVRIVEANSFSKAAETMQLPRASLTATLQNLEAYLGTRLLQRTTRRLSLTVDGTEYFAHCQRILADIEAVESLYRKQAEDNPKGKLKVDLPGALGRNLVLPRIPQFLERYPALELALSFSDRHSDLTQEGVDCAVRVGALQDSSMIGRQVSTMHFINCAAPAYLQRYGVPASIDDLAQHRSVLYTSGRTGRIFDWDFVIDGQRHTVKMEGTIAVNDADAYMTCGLQGLGLIQAARYLVQDHLASGALVEVLPQWHPAPMPVSLLYPQGRSSSPKLSVFIDWIGEVFNTHPDFSGPQ